MRELVHAPGGEDHEQEHSRHVEREGTAEQGEEQRRVPHDRDAGEEDEEGQGREEHGRGAAPIAAPEGPSEDGGEGRRVEQRPLERQRSSVDEPAAGSPCLVRCGEQSGRGQRVQRRERLRPVHVEAGKPDRVPQ